MPGSQADGGGREAVGSRGTQRQTSASTQARRGQAPIWCGGLSRLLGQGCELFAFPFLVYFKQKSASPITLCLH